MYRSLQAERVVETVAALEQRINARFPESGLRQVAAELHRIAQEAHFRSARIRRPNFLIRFFGGILALGILTLLTLIVANLRLVPHFRDIAEFVSFTESALGAVVFIGAAIFFLLSLDTRLKRQRALAALHELRAMAHIIDMHQLTKDPERLRHSGPDTQFSPTRSLSVFELGRYLDHCSELLSLVSKIAALYAQGFPDRVALEAVDQVESLTTGLSRKIWQKILVLGTSLDTDTPPVPPLERGGEGGVESARPVYQNVGGL